MRSSMVTGVRVGLPLAVMDAIPPVFDGHNDVVLRLVAKGQSFFDRNQDGHIDLPRAREGGLGGGFCALSVPGAHAGALSGDLAEMVKKAIQGLPPQEMVPVKGTEFALKTIADLTIEFKRDEHGTVTEVLVNQMGVVLTAPKRT